MADMSRPEEHTPLSLDKRETQAEGKDKETRNRQLQEDEDQPTIRHCHHQHAAVEARSPSRQDSRTRLSEAPDTRSDYGSVDAVSTSPSVSNVKIFLHPVSCSV